MDELQVELAKWYHPAAQYVKCMRREHEAHERVGHPPNAPALPMAHATPPVVRNWNP
jgi:hypothetical protein